MMQVQLFDIVSITLGAIKHFPATAERNNPFWTLDVLLKNRQGQEYKILAFASAPEHLEVATANKPVILPFPRSVTDSQEPLAQAA